MLQVGDDDLAAALLPGDTGFSTFSADGQTKRIYLPREWAGATWAGTTAALTSPIETTLAAGLLAANPPSRVTYTGIPSVGDKDGDGISDAMDLSPTIFSPLRPGDGGNQSDYDADGIGDKSDPSPLVSRTASAGLLPAPKNLRGSFTGGISVQLEWDAVPGAGSYLLKRDGIGGSSVVYSGLATQFRDDSTVGGHNFYTYYVQAVNAAGLSPLGGGNIFVTPQSTLRQVNDPLSVGAVATNRQVELADLVVTSIGANFFFVQDRTGGDYSGAYVFSGTAPSVVVGDEIDLRAATSVFFAVPQLVSPIVTLHSNGSALPNPVVVTEAGLADQAAGFAKLRRCPRVP